MLKTHSRFETPWRPSMEKGMALGESLLKPFADADKNEYENRMIFMTEAITKVRGANYYSVHSPS